MAEQPPPSLLGIVHAGVQLQETPAGNTAATLPAGTTLTVTGLSADGRYVAAYTAAGTAGWVERNALRLFGDVESLLVVDEPFRPDALDALLVDAQKPVDVLDTLLRQLTATPSATPSSSTASLPPRAQQNGEILGIVTVQRQGLNVRAGPGPEHAIIGRLIEGDTITITGRTVDGDWLQIETDTGVGWVSAAFVAQQP